ncbi:MAG: hypothetical protein ACRDUY_11755 [Nitriliruptorales bacterium]
MTQLNELLAMVLIGDGVLGAVIPARHVRRWERGPEPWRRTLECFARRPGLVRVLALAEAGVGLWYASRLPARSSQGA